MSKSWNEFPCMDCLLKRTCAKMCFDMPTNVMALRNHWLECKQDVCMACGGNIDMNYDQYPAPIVCDGCRIIGPSMVKACVGARKY